MIIVREVPSGLLFLVVGVAVLHPDPARRRAALRVLDRVQRRR